MRSYLKKSAEIIKKIRHFFDERGLIEVQTPLLSDTTVTDIHLNSISANLSLLNKIQYLQTSPEFYMKRFLVAGSGDIYQICKAFRDGEKGRWHSPEFTILEWYRLGFNHHDLMDEMDEFLQFILNTSPAIRLSYRELFQKYLNINPFLDDISVLKNKIKMFKEVENINYEDRDILLQLLMAEHIEPKLTGVVFIYDYPISQAMLAQIRHDDPPVAERFEVYVNGIELANGFHELADAAEQRKRFENDLEKRKAMDLPQVPIDENFLKALEKGLPNCAGVALGIDRLITIFMGETTIHGHDSI